MVAGYSSGFSSPWARHRVIGGALTTRMSNMLRTQPGAREPEQGSAPTGRLKKWLIWGGMAAFLAWCVLGFRRDIAQIDIGLVGAAWPAIAAAAGLSVFNYVLRIWRWHWYMSHQGHVLPLRFVSLTFMAGFAFTLSPGKLGEMARARYYQARGVPLSAVSGAFFVERILDLLAMILLAFAALLNADRYRGMIWIAAALVLGLLMLIALCPWSRVRTWLADRPKPLPGHGSLTVVVDTMVSSRRLLSPKMLVAGLLLGLVSWGGEAAGLKLVADAMAPGQLPWSGAASAYAVALIAGALSFLPGGLGSTEAVMAALLMAHGISAPLAILLTLICRLLTLWLAVVIGWACVWLLRREPSSF